MSIAPRPARRASSANLAAALSAGLAISAVVACMHRAPDGPNRRLTGTCEGACELYVACKHDDRAHVADACLTECREVFTDRESLRMFESLECAKVIGFVEGDSGRPPVGDLADTTTAQ